MKITKGIPLLLCFFISACSNCPLGPPIPTDPAQASILWDEFESLSSTAFDYGESVSLAGSLRFGTSEETHRVTYILWARAEEILRMDVSAGIGVNIFKMQENASTFLLYIPQEEKAYYYLGKTKDALKILGLSLPFSPLDLSSFLFGNFLAPFDAIQVISSTQTNEGLWAFTFVSQGMEGNIFLNDQAIPERIEIIQAENVWSLELDYKDTKLSQVKIEEEQGYHSIILLKEHKSEQKGEVFFSQESMNLTLPEKTPIFLLQ